MIYVYILQSAAGQSYIGFTDDLRKRVSEHNSGKCCHTAKYRPWTLLACVAVLDQETAVALERYLKSGSGMAFWRKRLVPNQVPCPPKPWRRRIVLFIFTQSPALSGLQPQVSLSVSFDSFGSRHSPPVQVLSFKFEV